MLAFLKKDCVKKLMWTQSRDGDNLETRLRESQSTVKQLTRQIEELRVVVVSLKESQNFKGRK